MVPWLAVVAVGATLGVAKKIVARYLHGTEIPQIHEDPPDVRTVCRVELAEGTPVDVLAALAQALADVLPGCAVSEDAIRAHRPGTSYDVDVIRVRRHATAITLELARAWTGPRVGAPDREILTTIHEALVSHPAVRDVTWHWRQDKRLVVVHARPVAT